MLARSSRARRSTTAAARSPASASNPPSDALCKREVPAVDPSNRSVPPISIASLMVALSACGNVPSSQAACKSRRTQSRRLRRSRRPSAVRTTGGQVSGFRFVPVLKFFDGANEFDGAVIDYLDRVGEIDGEMVAQPCPCRLHTLRLVANVIGCQKPLHEVVAHSP